METGDEIQSPLFASPIEGFVANLSWRVGEGWRLWVSSWDTGQAPARARTACYERLTADEAVDVLQAEQLSRCEWLRD